MQTKNGAIDDGFRVAQQNTRNQLTCLLLHSGQQKQCFVFTPWIGSLNQRSVCGVHRVWMKMLNLLKNMTRPSEMCWPSYVFLIFNQIDPNSGATYHWSRFTISFIMCHYVDIWKIYIYNMYIHFLISGNQWSWGFPNFISMYNQD